MRTSSTPALKGNLPTREWKIAERLLLRGGKRHRQPLVFPRSDPEGTPHLTPQDGANDLQRHFGFMARAVDASQEEFLLHTMTEAHCWRRMLVGSSTV
eukprot:8075526-Pyramimonas_sp.AAC.1